MSNPDYSGIYCIVFSLHRGDEISLNDSTIYHSTIILSFMFIDSEPLVNGKCRGSKTFICFLWVL